MIKTNKIKRARGNDDVYAHRGDSMNKKNKANNVGSSTNYYSPLQTVDEDNLDDEVLVKKNC